MAALNPLAPVYSPGGGILLLPHYIPISLPSCYSSLSWRSDHLPTVVYGFSQVASPIFFMQNSNTVVVYVSLYPPPAKIPYCGDFYLPSLSSTVPQLVELMHEERDEKQEAEVCGGESESRDRVYVGLMSREEGAKKQEGRRHGKMKWVEKREGVGKFLKQRKVQSARFEEGWTTLMIRNIPNKYREMLLSFLDRHCLDENKKLSGEEEEAFCSAYDFVYLPMDFMTGCNLGYAFVNFTDTRAASKFQRALNDKKWDVLDSKKICEITLARVQGGDACEKHFENSIFPCDTEEYLPLRFVPQRDGSCKFSSYTIGKRRSR